MKDFLDMLPNAIWWRKLQLQVWAYDVVDNIARVRRKHGEVILSPEEEIEQVATHIQRAAEFGVTELEIEVSKELRANLESGFTLPVELPFTLHTRLEETKNGRIMLKAKLPTRSHNSQLLAEMKQAKHLWDEGALTDKEYASIKAILIEKLGGFPKLTEGGLDKPEKNIKRNKETTHKGEAKKDLAERHQKRIQFWEGLLPVLNEKTTLFKRINPSKDNWLAAGTGIGGVHYQVIIRMESASIQLSIERDRTGEMNKKIFDFLYERKEKIEAAFGGEIAWRRMDDQISSKISHNIDDFGLDDASTWDRGYEVIANSLVRWDESFKP